MRQGAIKSLVIIFVSFVAKVFSSNRTFNCGFLNGYLPEYDAMNFFVNHTSDASNVSSIIFKNFKIPEKIDLCNQASLLLQQNVVALVEGSQTNTSACALSEATGIPLIRLHGDSGPFDQCVKAIQMSAGYKDYAHATLDILNMFGWKNIVLLVDEGRWPEAGYFHFISQRSKLNVNFIQLSKQGESGKDPAAPILRAMGQIENFEAEVILFYANKENIELLLQQRSCKHSNKWILQGQVPLNVSSDGNNMVLAFKLPYIQSSTSDKLEQAVQSNNTTKDVAALAFDAANVISQAVNKKPCSQMDGSAITFKDMDAVLSCITEVSLDGLTGPVKFNENGKRRKIELEILNLRNNLFKSIGTWNSSKGAVLIENILHNVENSSTRKILQGRKLRAVVVADAPFVIKKKNSDGSFSYEGYCIDLLNELARNLKFTYEIYPSPDGMYGGETENGTWNGMIGELISKRADVAVAALTITERREKVVDFSVPYMHFTQDLLMKKPSSSGPIDLLQFMNPFDNYVWIATLASLVVISVAVFVLNYFSPYGYKDNHSRGTSEEFNFFNSVWFALASLLQQGADNTPRSLSGRILTGTYWFCVLILVSTYTANLAAFLTVKNAQNPIHHLEDIVDSSYQVAVLESSSTLEFLKTSQYEPYKKIWHSIQREGTTVKSTSQGIQWVREKDKFLFYSDGPLLKYVANQQPCDLTTVSGLNIAKGLALAFQANDPHVDDFTLAILRLHENDFLNNLWRKWWDNKSECPKEQETILSRKRIDLMSMLGVYVVMGVGIVVAFLTLIAEILWKRRAEAKVTRLN
ncbi:glutamate receptor ionotropic, kainate 2-like [Oculina patagonica]